MEVFSCHFEGGTYNRNECVLDDRKNSATFRYPFSRRQQIMARLRTLWGQLSGPVKVGIIFALLAIVLSLFGVFRNPDIPVNWRTIFVAVVIAGGTWGLIAWAIATAILDVEQDVEESQHDTGEA